MIKKARPKEHSVKNFILILEAILCSGLNFTLMLQKNMPPSKDFKRTSLTIAVVNLNRSLTIDNKQKF